MLRVTVLFYFCTRKMSALRFAFIKNDKEFTRLFNKIVRELIVL